MNHRQATIASAILFCFFYQLISEFIEAIYAYGLLGVSIPVEVASMLFLFAPALLIFLPRRLSGRRLALLGILVLAAGVTSMFLDTRLRLLLTGFGTAGFLVYLAASLSEQARQADRQFAGSLGASLGGGLLLFILFRAWNSGVYPYDLFWFRLITLALAVVCAARLLYQARQPAGEMRPEDRKPQSAGGFWKVAALSTGMIAALALLYFAFGSPNVIARWTGASYGLVLGLVLAGFVWLALALQSPTFATFLLDRRVLAVWNALFILSMLAAILPYQIQFPPTPGGYPLPEPPAGPLALPALIGMLLLFPVILVDFARLADGFLESRPSQRMAGAAFSLSSLFLLLMIFAQVFTTVYDYIPVVGPFFRDRFWLVFFILGLSMAFPLLLVPRVDGPARIPSSRRYLVAVAGLALAALLGAALSTSRPLPPSAVQSQLRVLTYNIQQGYSKSGSRNPHGQLALMQRENLDLIGLQESDTNRIAGGNADVVRYLADHLDMYAYYGPKVVPGTFGIALLSRYPIENPRTFYLFSEGEQVAAIHAQITIAGQRLNIFVTHLGNGGPSVQQEELLQEVQGLDHVLAMGDFNFRPGTEQYLLTRRLLADAWLLKWPDGVAGQGFNPEKRIDYIFLTPDLSVEQARFLTGPESDHPAFVVDVKW